MTDLFPLRHLRRVYCAGPLFNAAERQEMLRIANVLGRAGFQPFVPHADGMEFSPVRQYLIDRGHCPQLVGQWLHGAIFALDTYQVVVGCGSLVFNMNGRVPDEGAVAEATMAWMLGKPVVVFKEDARSAIAGRDNPLVVGPANFEHVAEIEQLGEALVARLAEHPLSEDWRVPCPPHLGQTLDIGERLWLELEALGPQREPERVADFMLGLFNRQADGELKGRTSPQSAENSAARPRSVPSDSIKPSSNNNRTVPHVVRAARDS